MNKTREMMDATHKRFSYDDWEAELEIGVDTDVHYGGYCIAGANCMCAEETQREGCLDWKHWKQQA